MPTKAELYAQMADKVATQLTGSWQEWAGFLTTASRLYKYPLWNTKGEEYKSETICRDDPLSGRAGCENPRTADRENPGIRYSAKRGKSAVESTTVCSEKC